MTWSRCLMLLECGCGAVLLLLNIIFNWLFSIQLHHSSSLDVSSKIKKIISNYSNEIHTTIIMTIKWVNDIFHYFCFHSIRYFDNAKVANGKYGSKFNLVRDKEESRNVSSAMFAMHKYCRDLQQLNRQKHLVPWVEMNIFFSMTISLLSNFF